jgi:hypothetical protein
VLRFIGRVAPFLVIVFQGRGTLLLLSKAQLQGTVIDDLWRQYFVDRQVKQAVESLSGIEPPTDFLHLIRKRVPALSVTDVRQSLGRATLSLDYRAAQSAPTPSAAPIPVGAGQRAWATRRTNLAAETAAVEAERTAPEGPLEDKTPWRHVTLRDLISSAGASHCSTCDEFLYCIKRGARRGPSCLSCSPCTP